MNTDINSFEWYEYIKNAGCRIKVKINTGSQTNILNLDYFQLLGFDYNKICGTSSNLSFN